MENNRRKPLSYNEFSAAKMPKIAIFNALRKKLFSIPVKHAPILSLSLENAAETDSQDQPLERYHPNLPPLPVARARLK